MRGRGLVSEVATVSLLALEVSMISLLVPEVKMVSLLVPEVATSRSPLLRGHEGREVDVDDFELKL